MIADKIKSADFKSEKHVPVIECADSVTPGAPLEVTVSVGKEIPHPNTANHFIEWIALYFTPKGSTMPVELFRTTFSAHSAAMAADAKGPAATAPFATCKVSLNGPGTLEALSYCNLHGLWQSAKELS